MIEVVQSARDKSVVSTPHLSFSRINRYLHCPEQYRLHYIENLRLRFPSANLLFGQILHQGLAYLFRDGSDPVSFFKDAWGDAKEADLTYSARTSWEKLDACGQVLLEKFLREEMPRLERIESVEKVFELSITSLDLPFVGVIDLVADLDGKKTLVDFKTSASVYRDHEVRLSDQLTAYQLAEPDAEQAALCVLVKTKEPKINWHTSTRSAEQLTEFLAKAELVSHEITSGHFYKRPGRWCTWCDYLPVCMGNTKKVEETLIRIT